MQLAPWMRARHLISPEVAETDVTPLSLSQSSLYRLLELWNGATSAEGARMPSMISIN